jgi:hypothetical protein
MKKLKDRNNSAILKIISETALQKESLEKLQLRYSPED